MSKNMVKAIPKGIAKAHKMKTMILTNNQLKKLPPKIGTIGWSQYHFSTINPKDTKSCYLV
jgi:hypothetical protein